jgi:hypothetical protein
MTVSELLSRMSSAEFTQWIGYFTLKAEEAQEAQRKRNLT